MPCIHWNPPAPLGLPPPTPFALLDSAVHALLSGTSSFAFFEDSWFTFEPQPQGHLPGKPPWDPQEGSDAALPQLLMPNNLAHA